MQKPRSMTGLPYFFSDALRVSALGLIGTTLVGVMGVIVFVISRFLDGRYIRRKCATFNGCRVDVSVRSRMDMEVRSGPVTSVL